MALPSLTRAVVTDFPAAVQGIAAIEQRIVDLRSWPGDFTAEIAAAQRLVVALREAFGIHEMTEAEMDAAHEQAVAELDRVMRFDPAEGSPNPVPDVPVAYPPYRYPALDVDWPELELRSAHGDR